MGHKRTYTWEFKVQMAQLLEKGEQNPFQISRDHHVTRSLLYVWWQLYQERGEAAFVPSHAFHCPPEVDRPQNAQEQIAHLERLCGQQALELDLLRGVTYLAQGRWFRSIRTNGYFAEVAINTTLGKHFAQHNVAIRLDPDTTTLICQPEGSKRII